MILTPDLSGRVAVVTGGSRGIGAATARALADAGAAVAIVGRDETALAGVASGIEAAGGRALPLVADCTDERQVHRFAVAVVEQLGVPEIVMPFAGGAGMPVPTSEETAEHWRSVLESDLTSMFMTTSAFLPAMIDHGRGSIVTMSSSAARQPAQSNAAYATAKSGVIAFTRHLANELGPSGIRVNCVAPSAVENDRMRQWMTQEQRDQLGESFPLGRIGQPEDVANAALFLASDQSSWITGVTLDVAGGKIMV
jgi:3-oxoacyl-[acyl-carrier protein] reductase